MSDLGKAIAGGLGVFVVWRSLRDETRGKISALINDALMDVERNRREKELAQQQIEIAALQPTIPKHLSVSAAVELPTSATVPVSSLSQLATPDADRILCTVIPHPSVVLIVGKRGSGKSALGYRLLELGRTTYTPYVIGLSEKAAAKLPDWIGIADSLDDVPPRSIVLIDEAYLRFHARDSGSVRTQDTR